MKRTLRISILITVALLLQVTLLPAYLADPFKPNLLIIVVTYLGLRLERSGAPIAFALGLILDCYSGIYPGLNAFSFLAIYFALNLLSVGLYTDRRLLMVLAVFAVTIANGLIQLLLLIIFSSAEGIYSSILTDVVPQSLMNSVIAAILFRFPRISAMEQRL